MLPSPQLLLPQKNESSRETKESLSAPTCFSNYYIQAATSANTRRAYQQDIRHFIRWGGLLPATTTVILAYLEQYATQLNVRTLQRRLVALSHWHTYQGFTDPTYHPAVRKMLSGIFHLHGKPPVQAAAMTLATLTTLANYLLQGQRLIDYRNNALLQIGFFGALRASELVSIRWEQLQWSEEGIEILIPRSKTDQEGQGQVCAIPYGASSLCPVTALADWCQQAHIQEGFIFRQLTRHQHVKSPAITRYHLSKIIKNLIQACQLPEAERYSSHSLRRGFATEASRQGAPFGAIMRQGRWRHEKTVLGYVEAGKRFEDNAASLLLNTKN